MTPGVQRARFGQMPDGTPVDLFTLTNRNGLLVRITNYGTIITELHVPDRAGRLEDIVLGFDSLAPYLAGHPYFGCTVGRVANRIAHGRFTLDGEVYQLACNAGEDHLHGGHTGFDKAVWQADPLPGPPAAVRFTHVSPDGDQGYPGRLEVAVVMSLGDDNALAIDYAAVTDRPTPVNLTNHTYFNLAAAGGILGHEVLLAADRYTPTDDALIPTGEILPVAGTPLAFDRLLPLGARLDQLGREPRGYDHNYVINRPGRNAGPAARVVEPVSGRIMEVHTTQPGVQLYTGHYLDGTITGKRARSYPRYGGFCLETQHFPDAVNQPGFPSIILRPEQTYRQWTAFAFSSR
jgi:aldose 1-epimerase